MPFNADQILSILDQCCAAFSFPMLDNGYVYLAATRLSLYRTEADWAMVIEVFGFSPRAGLPDTQVHTFASTLHNRNRPERYVKREAYDKYLLNNPNNESRFFDPIAEGSWQNTENCELVAQDAREITLRGNVITLPSIDEYIRHGIVLEKPPQIQVFEVCRFLANVARDSVLATPEEQRVSVLPEMNRILELEEWHHPNVVDDEDRPSGSETFQQLAKVLVTGDVGFYKPSQPPNTHWRNWPDGGSL